MLERTLRNLFSSNALLERALLFFVTGGIFYSLYLVFMVVPSERIMGAVQRIFYFHVGSAMSCYVMVGLLFMTSVLFLVFKSQFWDQLASAAAEVGTAFCAIMLFSGMIWGHSSWNTWWRWEPRLVSSLILLLLLFSYCLLRATLRNEEKLPNFSAIMGILIGIQIPIVIFSVRLLTPQEQLHPEVVANQGLRDARYVMALISSNLSLIGLGLLLFLYRARQEILRAQLLILQRFNPK